MAVLQREINQESIAAERTRKITLGVLVVLATFLILWWSFDSFQLWNEQGKEILTCQTAAAVKIKRLQPRKGAEGARYDTLETRKRESARVWNEASSQSLTGQLFAVLQIQRLQRRKCAESARYAT